MPDNAAVDVRVLGQLLLMQSVVASLPDGAILPFVTQGLSDIPGVEKVEFIADHSDDSSSTVRFRMESGSSFHGELAFKVKDKQVFEPYIDYIRNFSFMMWVILEERQQQQIIKFHQHDLELQVEERSAELLRERNLAQHYLDIAGVMLMALDTHGRITMINRKGAQLIGKPESDLLGMDWFENFIPAVRRNDIRQLFHGLMRGENHPYYFENRIVNTAGHQLTMAWNITQLRDEAGETTGILSSGEDITERKRAEKALRISQIVIDTAQDGYWMLDLTGHLLDANQAYAKMVGYSREELTGMHVSQLSLTTDTPELVKAAIQRAINEGHIAFETRHRRKDGTIADLEAMVTYMEENNSVFCFHRDISERKRAEADLRIAATAFESQQAITITDAEGTILRVNQAFTKITGYSAEEVIGKNPRILKSGRQDANFYADMWKSINSTGEWKGDIWNRRKNGEVYPEYLNISAVKNKTGKVTHYVASFTDMSQKKAAEDQIKHLAFYDPLTHLPNRRLLIDRLQQALASRTRSGRSGAVLFIDLDDFKTLNDALGHDIGDMLLQQVAIRLESCVREGDTVARLGGDEFVVMLEDLSEHSLEAASQTEVVGNKILASLNQPYQLAAHEYRNSSSIGATLFSDHTQSIDELLKQADIAMYQSKKAGRNTLRFFDPKMQETINARASLEGELRKAMEKRQFQLFYQIQVDRIQADGSRRPLGAEALIRWIHPERGLVSPVEFIPMAEENGMIHPIGLWVLDTACAQLKIWEQNALTRHLTLAVNVSPKRFRLSGFVAQVKATVQRHDINPKLLKLELTESLLLEDIGDTVATMNELSSMGIQFSLDDFGTGYSSLQYLKQLPLDQLKIDQSFVRELPTDSSDRAIVSTIIAMAQGLNLHVIAEGVETEEQRQFLENAGCEHYQGFLFSRPVPIDEFEALLKRGAPA